MNMGRVKILLASRQITQHFVHKADFSAVSASISENGWSKYPHMYRVRLLAGGEVDLG